MLRALGYDAIERYHINEGHAGLLTLEVLRESLRRSGRREMSQTEIDAVRRNCVFTTHTPVPAGHDRFPAELVAGVLDPADVDLLQKLRNLDGSLNMTHLALHLSHRTNGVSRRHGEVSRRLFAPHPIGAITNGIHAATWASAPMQEVFDRLMPGWRGDTFLLRQAVKVPNERLWPAHRNAKRRLLDFVNRETNAGLHVDTFTLGFARRAALYKRADMLFDQIERLQRIHSEFPIQLIYAGKAHPQDQGAKELIQRLLHIRDRLKHHVRLVYLENYDIRICRMMVAGVDLWLNTPEPPLEASGTSGMKAALNGVPSLSVLDGWWVEGCVEGITGWSIGKDEYALGIGHDRGRAVEEIYNKLEYQILPLFYRQRDRFIHLMKNCIAINGSYVSPQRMMQDYVTHAYLG
jgi:starch phosphorylase